MAKKKTCAETAYMPVTSIFKKVQVLVDIKKFGYKRVQISEFEQKLQDIIRSYDGRDSTIVVYQNEKPYQITIIEDEKYIRSYINANKKLFAPTFSKIKLGADSKEKKPRKPRKTKKENQ